MALWLQKFGAEEFWQSYQDCGREKGREKSKKKRTSGLERRSGEDRRGGKKREPITQREKGERPCCI